MKFKILKGTETFEKLWALHKEILRAEKAAAKLVTTVGGTDHFRSNAHLAGGVAGVVFATKPDGWKQVGTQRQPTMYLPREKNTELVAQFRALPVVKHERTKEICGYPAGEFGTNLDGNLVRYGSPGLQWLADMVLMDTGRAPYTPPNADFIEILESEYVRLSEGKKEARKRGNA